jgi:hypothetical protein
MPRTSLPAHPSPPFPAPLTNGLVCSACKAPMRLVTIEPHPRYANIDVQNYACVCGHNEDFLVARKD